MDSSTKIAVAGLCLWAGYLTVSKVIYKQNEPQRRKNKQSLTANHIDNQIDNMNRIQGTPVPANLDVPFYSRHNYNRRRRPIHTNYF